MKHVIIGTAGHVDHGKTALVKALTGIDTDRLEEEQRRGVTIELGFAYLDFEPHHDEQSDTTLHEAQITNSIKRVGIIDVPGHEKFIRNMLAGAGGIDLAMLIVAADEGVMPQTREHLNILSQLGINNGLVVITKLDKVDSDWLELVVDDVEQLVKGTFLESRPIVRVSAITGENISLLKQTLYDAVSKIEQKNTDIPFRLPVDRAFPVQGFGTIVTGTLIEGLVKVGDTAEILPKCETVTIRGIQVHGESVDIVHAGQRAAINIAGTKRFDVKRGDVLTACDTVNTTGIIDVKLSVLPDATRTIKNGTELHLYHGTRTLLAKATLLGGISELKCGESCYARLKLKEPLPCKRGDRFIIRFYSPLETLGGGVVLDSTPKQYRSIKSIPVDALKIREQGNVKQIADLSAVELGTVFTLTELCKQVDIDKKTCVAILDELMAEKRIVEAESNRFISTKALSAINEKCTNLLKSYYQKNPLRSGMDIAELRQKLLPDIDTNDANAVLNILSSNNVITITDNIVSLSDRSIELSPEQKAIHAIIIKTLQTANFEVPTPEELVSNLSKKEKLIAKQIIESMATNKELLLLSPQIFWLKEVYDDALAKLHNHFKANDSITLAQCRDLLNTSRKYALAFLEYLDRNRITRKEGDVRRLVR